MLIAQLSDCHVTVPGALCYDRVDTHGLLKQAIGRLLALSLLPDVVWITGDLVATGIPAARRCSQKSS